MRKYEQSVNFEGQIFDFRPKRGSRNFETVIFFQPNNSGIWMMTGGERPSYRCQAQWREHGYDGDICFPQGHPARRSRADNSGRKTGVPSQTESVRNLLISNPRCTYSRFGRTRKSEISHRHMHPTTRISSQTQALRDAVNGARSRCAAKSNTPLPTRKTGYSRTLRGAE